MGSKKHKKHKSERRERHEEKCHPSLKLILKVGSNSTPEYGTDSPGPSQSDAYYTTTTAQGTCGTDYDEGQQSSSFHKKSKKKKKKKDREKKHKRERKEKRHHHRHHRTAATTDDDENVAALDMICSQEETLGGDSSQDQTTTSSPLAEHMLRFADLKSIEGVAGKPVTRPLIAAVPPLLSPKSVGTMASEDDRQEMSLDDASQQSMLLSPSSSSASVKDALTREPRTCVLKQKQSKSTLGKVLDHVLRSLEKRDPHQFFAWPVTDDIAPGYSNIIERPMDFSTIRQKIEDNAYVTLPDFAADFRLMCANAVQYNHVDTVYHKAAKKLMHVGCKILQPESLMRSLRSLMVPLRSLSVQELGFELPSESAPPKPKQQDVDVNDTVRGNLLDSADEQAAAAPATDETSSAAGLPMPGGVATEPAARGDDNASTGKSMALGDNNDNNDDDDDDAEDSDANNVLEQVKRAAARLEKERVARRQKLANMGFVRQHKDGSTSMQILVDVNDTCGPERVISLGALTGPVLIGTTQLQSFREDLRNAAQPVKPLNYGAFASFAPVFDSRFANLSKEESELVLNTYGDETGAQYAESIIKYTQSSSYASTLANGLLDALTQGEHSKVMADLLETHHQQYDQRTVEQSLPDVDREKSLYAADVKVDYDRLRTLADLGIDVSFLDDMMRAEQCYSLQQQLHGKLTENSALIEKLHTVQYDRLSQPQPAYLMNVPKPDAEETGLATQITGILTDMAKVLTPEAVAPLPAVRKAMGVAISGDNLAGYTPKMNVYSLPGLKLPASEPVAPPQPDMDTTPVPMDIDY